MSTDKIEKKILLHAPRKRVWRALSDSAEFGHWFGMKFNGPFAPGAIMRGVIVPTKVDAEVASAQKKYDGTPFEITIDQMEPERLFSFRWHPGAVDPDVDYLRGADDSRRLCSRGSGQGRHANGHRVRFRSNPTRAPGKGLRGKRARLDNGDEVDRGVPCPGTVARGR
jgi:uncharacterized protein YndB with AHSA1/START domain